MIRHKFWMVYNPNGKNTKVVHVTLAEARDEARRLAVKEPGERFIVLESIFECATAAPEIETFQHGFAPKPYAE